MRIPLLIHAARLLARRPGFYGDYSSFEAAGGSYETSEIANAQTRSSGPFTESRVLQVMAALGACGAFKSILDVGGAHGKYFHAIKRHLPVQWTILETAEMVQACSSETEIRYVCDATQLDAGYDVVLLSGVLQYFPDPYAQLKRFAGLGKHLIINRLALAGRDRITRQTVTTPYHAAYPAWFLAEARFLEAVRALGTIAMRWQVAEDAPYLDGRRVTYQGMLVHVGTPV